MDNSTLLCAHQDCTLRHRCRRFTPSPSPAATVINGPTDCLAHGKVMFLNSFPVEAEKVPDNQLTLGDVLFNTRQTRTAA